MGAVTADLSGLLLALLFNSELALVLRVFDSPETVAPLPLAPGRPNSVAADVFVLKDFAGVDPAVVKCRPSTPGTTCSELELGLAAFAAEFFREVSGNVDGILELSF